MRLTEPKVRVIARPRVDWVAVGAYLEDVGGEEFLKTRLAPGGWDAGVRLPQAATNRRASEPRQSELEDLIEIAGRACYRSWAPKLNPNVSRIREDQDAYLRNILKSGHGSVLEHAYLALLFQDVSRVFTHELVRHRAGAAYSQESLRFVRLDDIPFWFPDWAHEDAELVRRSLALLDHMEEHQRWMAGHFGLEEDGVSFAEKKARTSFMRRLAPIGLTTTIVATYNVRALRHIIVARTAPHAEEEIRLVFDEVAKLCRGEAPALFGDLERQDDGSWTTEWEKV